MLGFLREWVRQLVLIVVLAGFIDMILPSGSMRKYAQVVVGLFIIMALLNPLLLLLRQDATWNWPALGEGALRGGLTGISRQGEILAATAQEQALFYYQRQLEEQVESLLHSLEEISRAQTKVLIDSEPDSQEFGGVVGIEIWVSQVATQEGREEVVERVEVSITGRDGAGEKSDGERELPEDLREQITDLLSNFFNLKPEAISVFAWDEGV